MIDSIDEYGHSGLYLNVLWLLVGMRIILQIWTLSSWISECLRLVWFALLDLINLHPRFLEGEVFALVWVVVGNF